MNRLFLLFVLFFITFPLFSVVVPSNELTSTYGISYKERQKSNYIEKDGYSFRYLGNGTWDVKKLNQITNSDKIDRSTGIVVFLFIVLGIIIVIGVCVSTITTEVAKSAGMDEKSAKKVGTSAGVLAGTAATIAAAILLGKAGEIKPNSNNITITHKR